MILAIWGPTKVWKTSLAMSFPKPLVLYDFDLGAHRAAPRFQDDIDKGLIEIRPYRYPLQFKVPEVMGVRELWETWLKDYAQALQEEWGTVVIDTSTQLYLITRHSYLQRLQETQLAEAKGKKVRLRMRLQPMEYAEPYARMDMVAYAARSFGKNLVLIHNSRKEFETVYSEQGRKSQATGRMEMDAYRRTGEMVDVIISMTREAGKPGMAVVEWSGLSPAMEGLTFEGLTYDKLVDVVEKTRVIPV